MGTGYGPWSVRAGQPLRLRSKQRQRKKPNPDKPERIATKAPRHKENMLITIKFRALVFWWSAAGGLDNSFASMM
jgi:hypothetical protein